MRTAPTVPLIAAWLAPTALAAVTLPSQFTDHMVVQQRATLPLWGWAGAGEAVRVRASWLPAPLEAVAGGDGRWRVDLATPEGGPTPHTITVAGQNTITLSDVLVGDVWVCAGQSNMEWALRDTKGGPESAAAANHPTIRLLTIANAVSTRPLEHARTEGGWRVCTPDSAGAFSAVGYFFGRDVAREAKVPVGLIAADWGGTPAEAWTPRATLQSYPIFARDLARVDALSHDPAERARLAAGEEGSWWDRLDALSGVPKDWASPEFDAAAWADDTLPGRFAGSLERHDGVVYYRRSIDLPDPANGQPAELSLGPIDDRDDAYVNGVRVGGTRDDNLWNQPRAYKVPPGVLRAGTNVVALRVLDTAGPGGLHGEAAQLFLRTGDTRLPLAGAWKRKTGAAMSALGPVGESRPLGPDSPTLLYNAMIAPLTSAPIKGVVWYQGESNAGDAATYRDLFPAMIRAWRDAWKSPQLPFYFVQIAPYKYQAVTQAPELREAQAGALALPHTAMAVTLDVGDPFDAHPAGKEIVGQRLARAALRDAYEVHGPSATGPTFSSAKVVGSAMEIEFVGAHGVVELRPGPTSGFVIAGDDRRFYHANAEVIGPSRVRVSHPAVAAPVAVRYAWSNAPSATLFDTGGNPAPPFRTDDWPRPPEGTWIVEGGPDRTEFLTREPGFTPLFDGRDLAGWAFVNTGPSTWRAEQGMIRCTGSPTGLLRTTDMHENFVLEFEFRFRGATGNAGLFVWSDALTAKGQPFSRSVEVQVMNGLDGPSYTSDGDIFAIHGATMTPVNPRPSNPSRSFPTSRRMLPAGEWNHYRVTCDRGDITLAVNGQTVTTAKAASPRKGYLCLESEGTPIDFRNLILKKLPDAPAPLPPEHVATPDEGFTTLFDGTFSQWKFEKAHEGHFKADDWLIDFDGQGDDLWTKRSYKDFVLIADWRWSGKPEDHDLPVILPDGSTPAGPDGKPATKRVPEAGDSGIYLRGSSKSQVNIWCWPVGSGEVYGYRTDKEMPPDVRAGVTPRVNADAPIGQWNRFVITMRGERLSVVLNGKPVLDNALLPGVAREGPIALQHHGGAIQFANLYIKELKE